MAADPPADSLPETLQDWLANSGNSCHDKKSVVTMDDGHRIDCLRENPSDCVVN